MVVMVVVIGVGVCIVTDVKLNLQGDDPESDLPGFS
jgi:hypothetical protein